MAANGTNSGSIFKVQKILSVILLSNLCLAWRKNKQLVWESWGLLNLRIIKHVTSKHHPKNFKKQKKIMVDPKYRCLFSKNHPGKKNNPDVSPVPNRVGPFWVTDDFPNFPWPVGWRDGSPPERSPNAGCRVVSSGCEDGRCPSWSGSGRCECHELWMDGVGVGMCEFNWKGSIDSPIWHVWYVYIYIYVYLPNYSCFVFFNGKCRQIYHTQSIWVLDRRNTEIIGTIGTLFPW